MVELANKLLEDLSNLEPLFSSVPEMSIETIKLSKNSTKLVKVKLLPSNLILETEILFNNLFRM